MKPKSFSRILRRIAATALLGTAALIPAQALAVQYESEIDISSEQDLYDLQLEGDISEETLETLLELFHTGIDLNTASAEELYELPNITYEHVNAILEYRKASHGIENPEALVAAGVLDKKLLLQILPFVTISDVSSAKSNKKAPVGGNVKYGLEASASDTKAPPMFLRARLKGPFNLQAGLLLMTTRKMIDEVVEKDGRLWADRPNYSLHVPKYYLQWKNSNFKVIAGTYRIGFGERLTLDNTTKSNPRGFYADDAYNTPQDLVTACKESKGDYSGDKALCDGLKGVEMGDYSWSHGFRGVAASGNITLGEDTELSGTVFISYEDKSIYQYQIYDAESCDNPHNPGKECKSPGIYVKLSDDDDFYGSMHGYLTLPHMFYELAGGGNATVKFGHRGQVGLTGYGAKSTFDDLGDFSLDFQEWARIPYGGPYGAVGINGAFFLDKVGLFAELARSFDSMPDGNKGGFGVVQRTVYNPSKKHELELTLRYYDRDFANPYSRATAAADTYDGNRGRNELGARLRYYGKIPDWIFSGNADFWMWPHDSLTYDKSSGEMVVDEGRPQGTKHLQLKTRAQFVGFDSVQPWLSFEYRNRDLSFNDNSYENAKGDIVGSCYDSGNEYDDDGNSVNCRGQFYRVGVGARLEPVRKMLILDLRYQHEFLNDKNYPDGLRQDVVASLGATYKPIPELNIRARVRYYFEDIQDNTYKEQSIWAYLAATYTLMKRYSFSLRYDFYRYLDERLATLNLDSVNQHRFRFEFTAKF